MNVEKHKMPIDNPKTDGVLYTFNPFWEFMSMSASENQKAALKRFYYNNKDKFAHYAANYRDGLKLEMVAAYGGECQHCGITDPVVLSLDHTNNDSHIEKELFRGNSRGGGKLYAVLKKQGWPQDRFQLLCFNCNARKEHERRRTEMLERWGNPEEATTESRSVTQANVGVRAHNTSGFKGVFWNRQKNKWQATINHDYKAIHIGFFEEIEDAVKAHRAKTVEFWGDKVKVLSDEEITQRLVELTPKPATVNPEDLGL